MKCSLGISNFLEEISSLSYSSVFLCFFALITDEGFLSLLAILWNSAFRWVYFSLSPLPFASLLFSTICKAPLTSHSRMSGSMWVIIPSWLSGSWRSFLYSSSVYSCHLFLISLLLLGPYHFCPLSSSSLHEVFPWYLLFSWSDLYLFPFCCFPLFLCIDCWGRLLISPCYSLELCIQMGISFFFSFAFLFSSFQLFVRPPQTAILPFCIYFPWGWSWSLSPVQCHEPLAIVHHSIHQI